MFHKTSLAIAIAIFIASATCFAEPSEFQLPPNGFVILPASHGAALLKQCSRSTPQNVSEFWQPSQSQIAVLEKSLPNFILARATRHEPIPDLRPYHRQYVGVVVNGERLIYGNFYPSEKPFIKSSNSLPVVICDGGPAFWGILYSPKSGAFRELMRNGVA